MRLFTFTNIRIGLLLLVLLFTAFYTLHQYVFSRNWNKTLDVVIYPINGDNKPETKHYIESLTTDDFSSIDEWSSREAKRYNLLVSNPFWVNLGAEINTPPPELPERQNALQTVWWGLKLRWWAYRNTPDDKSNLERIRMFVIYQQGEDNKPLRHSLGLQKGLLGVVHVYAKKRQTAQNNIVIGHELLHTVGALDKYDETGLPIFPEGYAEPGRKPLYPQRRAEIMAGHIPITADRSHMAASLNGVVINEFTAREINWIDR